MNAGPMVLASLLASGLAVSSARADAPMFFVDAPFDPPQTTSIYVVDPLTGVMTARADLGTTFTPVLGLAAADGTTLYASGSDTVGATCNGVQDTCLLLKIVLDPLSTTPTSVTIVGPVRDGTTQITGITGMTFRNDGVLYVHSQDTEGIYTLDPATAQATLVGTATIDIHGGDLTFDADDRLLLWTNGSGTDAALYRMDPATAAATLIQMRPGSNLSGLAALGHSNVLYGSEVFDNTLETLDPVTGFTGLSVPLTLGGLPFEHKRGDLDSPYCTNDAACDDANPCTTDRCTPGGCRHLFLDASCDGIDDDCDGLFDEDAVAPGGVDALTMTRQSSGSSDLSWTPVPAAQTYDVVRGDLASLISSAGDFTASVDACTADTVVATTASDPSVPAEGGGYWYLVRASNCGGAGTYDGPVARQSGPRDAEIAASSSACP